MTLGASAHAQLNLKHVLRLDLSGQFNANSASGFDASDVAVKDNDVFIAGFTGGVGNSGVLKISDIFGSATQTQFKSFATTAGNNDSKLAVAADGDIIFASNLGQVNTSTVRKFSSADGTDRLAFGGDGVLTSQELVANGRLEAIAIDPLGGFGSLLRGSGINRRRFQSDGAQLSNDSGFFNGAIGSAWRDIAYDSNGNMYMRENNDVIFASRATTTSFNISSTLVDIADADLAVQNIHWVAGSGGNSAFLAYNSRVAGANQVQLISEAGASLLALTGTEEIGGIAQAAFDTNLLNFSSANIGGKDYLFVTQGGANDKLSIYEIEAVPEPATMIVLAGAAAIAARRRRKNS